jgi:hypothetical protein
VYHINCCFHSNGNNSEFSSGGCHGGCGWNSFIYGLYHEKNTRKYRFFKILENTPLSGIGLKLISFSAEL